MRRRTARTSLLTASAVAATCAAVAVAPASADGKLTGQDKKPFEVGLVGDMPYGDYGRSLCPNVLTDLNGRNLAFSTFDGDTKNGSASCFADADPATATATWSRTSPAPRPRGVPVPLGQRDDRPAGPRAVQLPSAPGAAGRPGVHAAVGPTTGLVVPAGSVSAPRSGRCWR